MKLFGFIALALTISSCGYETVPPAHVGKVLSPSGYSKDIKKTGRYWMGIKESMVLVETGVGTFKEAMTVKMRDRLDLTFDVRGRVQISGGANVINSMFDNISVQGGILGLNTVYATYGKMLVRNVSREVLSKYSVDDVHKNYPKITKELYTELKKAFESVPLKLSDVALGSITYPKVITDAIEQNKKREEQINQERAQTALELEKKKRELKMAEANKAIRLTKARTIAEENKIVGNSVSEKYIQYRRLEVQEAMAQNPNTVFFPVEGLVNPAMQRRLFGK
jgi:hypothetical protein